MGAHHFEIAVPDPFRLDLTVWTLRRRAHNLVDHFDGTGYRRTLMVSDRPLAVAVRQQHGPDTPVLAVELRSRGAAPDQPVADEAGRALARLLGLGVDLSGFYRLADRDPRLTGLAGRFVGMRPPRFPTVFEALVNAIACQQLSLEVGIHLLNRLAQRYGPRPPARVDAPPGFPTAEGLAGADPQDLRDMGFSLSKARALVLLAGRVASGDLDLEGLERLDDEGAGAALLGIHGIGRWSAEYTLLRGLGRLHVLPGDDVGARNNLRKRFGLGSSAGYDAVSELSRAWSPYGGLVYFHLLLDGLDRAGRLSPPVPTEPPPPGARPLSLDRGGAP